MRLEAYCATTTAALAIFQSTGAEVADEGPAEGSQQPNPKPAGWPYQTLLNHHPWRRVGSHSNPSDAPSRLSVEDIVARGAVKDQVAWMWLCCALRGHSTSWKGGERGRCVRSLLCFGSDNL